MNGTARRACRPVAHYSKVSPTRAVNESFLRFRDLLAQHLIVTVSTASKLGAD
jgi:hypothetical protein